MCRKRLLHALMPAGMVVGIILAVWPATADSDEPVLPPVLGTPTWGSVAPQNFMEAAEVQQKSAVVSAPEPDDLPLLRVSAAPTASDEPPSAEAAGSAEAARGAERSSAYYTSCAPGSLDGQTPYLYGSAYACDETPGYGVWERFTASGPLRKVTWWGQELDYDAAGPTWTDCDRGVLTFRIYLVDDATGTWYAEDVLAWRTPVFVTYYGWVYRYEAALTGNYTMASGRIRIRGAGSGECWFWWLASYYDDGIIEHWNGSQFVASSGDAAFCLSSESYEEICPPQTVLSQPPLGPFETEGAVVSETDRGQYPHTYAIEHFSGITEPVQHIRWWGREANYDGSWSPCSRAYASYTFLLAFYDAGGTLASSWHVHPSRVHTGVASDGDPIYQYDADLSAPLSLTEGYLGIIGINSSSCWFLWETSGTGDDYMLIQDDTGTTAIASDLAYCLSGLQASAGACEVQAQFAQAPLDPGEWWHPAPSSQGSTEYAVFEDFYGVTAPINRAVWYGIEGFTLDGGENWELGLNPIYAHPYKIVFSYDLQDLYSVLVYPNRVDTGARFGAHPIYRYSATFPPVALSYGWVSIQGPADAPVRFLWMSGYSESGGYSEVWQGGVPAYGLSFNTALCLYGDPIGSEGEGGVPFDYPSGNVALTLPPGGTIVSSLMVNDAFVVRDVNLTLDISHPCISQLQLLLKNPAGATTLLVASGWVTCGPDYSGTTFDDEAEPSILSGFPPCTGTFRPQNALRGLEGTSSQGEWQLIIMNSAGGSPGTLNSWNLQLQTGPPDVALDASSVDFGFRRVGDATGAPLCSSIANQGDTSLHLSSVQISGPDAADFMVSTPPSSMTVAGYGNAVYACVSFVPQTTGLKQAFLEVLSDDPDEPAVYRPLTGIAFDPALGWLSPVWVNFANSTGTEDGSEAYPFNTFGEGSDLVLSGGTVRLTAGETLATLLITKAMRLEAVLGTVRVGSVGGYGMKDNTEPGGPAFDWIEIAGTGTNHNLTDDSFAYPVVLPFTFNFFDTPYTQVSVCSNGGLRFENADLTFENQPIPSYLAGPLVALYWDDLYPGGANNVYTQIAGTAPNRKLVVQWQNVNDYTTSGYVPITVQAQLHENGDILLLYSDVPADAGVSASVGIQKDSTLGIQYSHNQGVLTDGLAIRFRNP